ncbi:hypothetical protein WJX81_002598 [Elliptochloris bilobata]|uniref:Uncharacterized protein n=1 Tax=Elliptochloris bilobata TaxID=381761 RepID=A0AAW1RCT2_9CHLO
MAPILNPALPSAREAPAGPLEGFKVLDFGQVVAGNFCGALLAYFGAKVIKVESPRGDALRSLRLTDESGTSLWWRSYGRNRKCITLDLHKEEGRELARRLAQKADVLVENFRPGVMEKWGLGPQDLSPELVYVRISGYGQTGPKAPLAGYASVCEAYGGIRHLNGYADRAPVRANISLGDSLAGLHAAFGAVMALLHRQRSGRSASGQVVDAAISESCFNMLDSCVPEFASHGFDRPPSGSTISGVVPSATLRTRDGKYVIIGGNGDSVYSRLMAAVGRPDMDSNNPTYADNARRCEREAEIYQVLGDWVATRTLEEVLDAMVAARVPSGPILSTGDIMREEQYHARGMFHEVRPPSGGPAVTVPALVPKLSSTPGGTQWAGPELGEHTADVLREELGVDEKELARLRETGVV